MKTAICRTMFFCCLWVPALTAETGGGPKTTLRVASLMLEPVKWEKAVNTKRLEEAIRKAAAQGAEIVVTPEGALEGYVVNLVRKATGETRARLTDRFNAMAEPCDGPSVQHFKRLAGELGVYLVFGFLERDGENTCNTVVLIGADGETIGRYRKTHFAQGYRTGLKPGENPTGYLRGDAYPVFPVKSATVGMMICYDRRVPKVARSLAQHGATLIVNPAYGMRGDCNRDYVSARALENGVPVVFVHPRQTVVSDGRGEIHRDVRAEKDAICLLDVPVRPVEKKPVGSAPIRIDLTAKDGFASFAHRHHPDNRIGYRFFEHTPMTHGVIPKTVEAAGIDRAAIGKMERAMCERPGLTVYRRTIRSTKPWADQVWTFYMVPVDDGIDVLWLIETGETGLPAYYGVQQCFRMSGRRNASWRRRIAETPAFSEYDLWTSEEGRAKKTSLSYMRRDDRWVALPAGETPIGARTPLGVRIDRERFGEDLPEQLGPYRADMLAPIDGGLVTRSSVDSTWISGIFWECTSHVTDHHPADCLHAIVNVGNVPAHARRALRGKIFWFKGSRSDLLARWKKAFP